MGGSRGSWGSLSPLPRPQRPPCDPPGPPQAFTETQKKRLQSWKQQVLKLLRAFPKKGPLDGPPGYRPPKRYLWESPCCWNPPHGTGTPPVKTPKTSFASPASNSAPGGVWGLLGTPPQCAPPAPVLGGLTPARVFCTVPTLGGLGVSPTPLKFGEIWGGLGDFSFSLQVPFSSSHHNLGEGSKGSPPSLPNFPFFPIWGGGSHPFWGVLGGLIHSGGVLGGLSAP